MDKTLFGLIDLSNVSDLTVETINRLYSREDLVSHHQDLIPFLSQHGINLYPADQTAIIQSRDATTPLVAFRMDNVFKSASDLTPEIAKQIYIKTNIVTAGQAEKDIINKANENIAKNRNAMADADDDWRAIDAILISDAKDDINFAKHMKTQINDDTILDKNVLRTTMIQDSKYLMKKNIKKTQEHLNNINKFFDRHIKPLAESNPKLIKPISLVAKREITWA